MARAWRIEYEGAYYHLLSRGNERRDIFICDENRRLFLDTICECGERFEIELFSYVLLSNDYHLRYHPRYNPNKEKHAAGRSIAVQFNNILPIIP
jgi:putative transposase